MGEDLYTYTFRDISGRNTELSAFRGKKIMIVNTALHCGFTGQLLELQKLYEQYRSGGFEIIAFPSNSFRQEWDHNDQVAVICQRDLGLSFTMAEKTEVRGKNKHPLYRWLTSRRLNGTRSSVVVWNFQKYLINADGTLHNWFFPWTRPFDPKIISWLGA